MDVSYLISELWWKGGQKITKNKLHPTLLCILNHSMSTLRKAEGCMCCQWMESVLRPRPQCVAFISVPACEGIKVNERGDSLTGKQWAKLLFWMLLRLSIFSFQVQLHVLARKLKRKLVLPANLTLWWIVYSAKLCQMGHGYWAYWMDQVFRLKAGF